jgi:hypothetical protein
MSTKRPERVLAPCRPHAERLKLLACRCGVIFAGSFCGASRPRLAWWAVLSNAVEFFLRTCDAHDMTLTSGFPAPRILMFGDALIVLRTLLGRVGAVGMEDSSGPHNNATDHQRSLPVPPVQFRPIAWSDRDTGCISAGITAARGSLRRSEPAWPERAAHPRLTNAGLVRWQRAGGPDEAGLDSPPGRQERRWVWTAV